VIHRETRPAPPSRYVAPDNARLTNLYAVITLLQHMGTAVALAPSVPVTDGRGNKPSK